MKLCLCIDKGKSCESRQRDLTSKFCKKHKKLLLIGYGLPVTVNDKDILPRSVNNSGSQIYLNVIHDHLSQWCEIESVTSWNTKSSKGNCSIQHNILIDSVRKAVKMAGSRFLVKIED